MNKRQYWALAAVVFMAFLTGRWSANSTPASAKAEQQKGRKTYIRRGKVERTDVTLQELRSLFSKRSKLTNLQRQERFEQYKGKMVRWQGALKKASYIDGELSAVFSHRIKPSSPLGRRKVTVVVNFAESEKSKLLDAQKGTLVTYEALLGDPPASKKQPWRLTDGQVVSVELAEKSTPEVTSRPSVR
jgi:hypothetical protein